MWDFCSHYETEALLRGRDERQAREEVHRLGERLGNYRRFRVPYLRSLAALAAWNGQSEQAIGHLQEAAQLAADLACRETLADPGGVGKLHEAMDSKRKHVPRLGGSDDHRGAGGGHQG